MPTLILRRARVPRRQHSAQGECPQEEVDRICAHTISFECWLAQVPAVARFHDGGAEVVAAHVGAVAPPLTNERGQAGCLAALLNACGVRTHRPRARTSAIITNLLNSHTVHRSTPLYCPTPAPHITDLDDPREKRGERCYGHDGHRTRLPGA